MINVVGIHHQQHPKVVIRRMMVGKRLVNDDVCLFNDSSFSSMIANRTVEHLEKRVTLKNRINLMAKSNNGYGCFFAPGIQLASEIADSCSHQQLRVSVKEMDT